MGVPLFPHVVVNGETVPQAVIAAEAQNQSAPKGKPGIAWRKAANAIAIRTLLLQEAQHQGLEPTRKEVGPGRFETDEEALIRGLLEQCVIVEPPSDAAVAAEWAKDRERFRAPPLWEVSHILIACDPRDEAARKTAKARAVDLTSMAHGASSSFAQLAKDNSDCGSRENGGALGQLGPGDTVPEFEAVVRTLLEGQITAEPILTRHGWHVIRLDALAMGQVLPFESVKSKISDAMEKVLWAREARRFVNQLVASAKISGADLRSGKPGGRTDEHTEKIPRTERRP